MMTENARAVASLFMLMGMYLVALAQFVVAVALAVWVASMSTGFAGTVVRLLLLFALGATAVALWRALRFRPETPRGLLGVPSEIPQLWQLVQTISADVGARAPDEIRLTSEVSASLSDDSRLLGILGGTRRCYIGMPLLQAFTVDQLRAVLAHELGHYSRRQSRLGEIACRGRAAIVATVGRIGPANPIGWSFKLYARLYLHVDNLESRRREVEADRLAFEVAGRDAAVSSLKELQAFEPAWDFYFSRYVAAGWEAGYSPDDLFGGFGKMLAARQDELDRLRAHPPTTSPSTWDTHPAIADRIADMEIAQEESYLLDRRSATELVPDHVELARGVQALISSSLRVELSWPEFTHTVMTAKLQRAADRIFREVCRHTGSPEAGLSHVFDLIAAGSLAEIATALFPNATRRELPELFAAPMESLLELAAVRSEKARWRHSWSGPAILVDVHGAPMHLDSVAQLAVAPETLGQARIWLAAEGIDISGAAVADRQASGAGARVIAGLANVHIDDADHDLILLDRGLVLVPEPADGDGKARLKQLVTIKTPQELAANHRFVPFEDVADVSISRQIPVRARLKLNDGTAFTLRERWTSVQMNGDSSKALLRALDRLKQP